MIMEDNFVGIKEEFVKFTSPTDFMVSIFRNHDPETLTRDDYDHMKKLMKKFWNEEKNADKLRKAHWSYWELMKKKNLGVVF